MSKTKNIQAAIALLENCKSDLQPLLADVPSLHLRVTTTFDRLVNGLKVMNGQPLDVESADAGKESAPLKSILGRSIERTAPTTVKKASKTEVDLLRETARTLYDTFLDREAKEILDAASDMEIRAVAKLAGMKDVTSTVPAKVGPKFIDSIKDAIKAQKDLETEKRTVKILEARSEVLKKEGFTLNEANGKFALGDHIIGADELVALSDEEFIDGLDKALEAMTDEKEVIFTPSPSLEEKLNDETSNDLSNKQPVESAGASQTSTSTTEGEAGMSNGLSNIQKELDAASAKAAGEKDDQSKSSPATRDGSTPAVNSKPADDTNKK